MTRMHASQTPHQLGAQRKTTWCASDDIRPHAQQGAQECRSPYSVLPVDKTSERPRIVAQTHQQAKRIVTLRAGLAEQSFTYKRIIPTGFY